MKKRFVISHMAALIALLANPAHADQGSVLAPPDVASYKELTAKWWQWAASTPISNDGPFSPTGPNCGENQPHGKIFFLAGRFTPDTVNRICEVPRNKWLFLPVINVECSSNEVGTPYGGLTVAERQACANKDEFAPNYSTLYTELDGEPIVSPNQLKDYSVTSPNFPIIAVPNNAAWIPEGRGFAVSKGVWLLLAPLSPGLHTLSFGGENNGGFRTDAAYTITVK